MAGLPPRIKRGRGAALLVPFLGSLLAPLVVNRKGLYTDLAKWARGKGYTHLRVDGEFLPTDRWPRLDRFRERYVNITPGGLRANRLYAIAIAYLVPIEFAGMFAWWIYQAVVVFDPQGWWNPLHPFSVGTCLVQWGVALALLLKFNAVLARTAASPEAGR